MKQYSAEDMNKFASFLTWEEQWAFLRERELSVQIKPAEKRGMWSVDVCHIDGKVVAGTSSGRRDAAVSAAIVLAYQKMLS